jgi:hypothetical protein
MNVGLEIEYEEEISPGSKAFIYGKQCHNNDYVEWLEKKICKMQKELNYWKEKAHR